MEINYKQQTGLQRICDEPITIYICIFEFRKEKTSNELYFNGFRRIRAKYAYVTFSTLPDALIYVAILAQYTEKRFINEKNDSLKSLK